MLKVILKYTDCLGDKKKVFSALAANNVKILKTKERPYNIYPEITIIVKDYNELNNVVSSVNCHLTYGVQVMKTKQIKDGKKIFGFKKTV